MKDTCTSDNLKDFKQRYQNTVGILLKDNGAKEWVWIENVDDHSVNFKTKSGQQFQAINGNGVTFEFTQVPMGWFNTSKGPVYICRRPARQWQRGISAGNTSIISSKFRAMQVSLDTVAEAMTSNYEYTGKLPTALSRYFCIAEDKTLYFRDIPIGTFDPDTDNKSGRLVIPAACEVWQELKDLVRRNRLPFTVELETK